MNSPMSVAVSASPTPSFIKPHDQDVDVTWFDQQRRHFATYEYMCRIQEAREWIEETLREAIPCSTINEFEEMLRDGVLLCRIMRVFQPEVVKRIFMAPTLQFRHSDNLVYFWKGTQRLSLPSVFSFELVDLYDKKNIPKVIYCIHALSHLIGAKGLGPLVKNLQGKCNFDEAEIAQKESELAQAGIALPAFSKVSQLIVDHLEKEVQKIDLSPEPQWDLEKVCFLQSQILAYFAAVAFQQQAIASEIIGSTWRMLMQNESFYSRVDLAFVTQTLFRSAQLQNQFGSKKIAVPQVQCAARRAFALRTLQELRAAIFLQSLFRSCCFSSAFMRILRRSPTLKDIMIFLPMLFTDEGSQVLQQEIELDQMRLAINRKINEIQEKEEHCSDLDVKVGLLLRNTLTLQDFVKETKSSNAIQPAERNNSGSSSNASTLLRLDKDNHTKMKQYRQLFYLLQTDPKYLVEILTLMPAVKARSMIEDCILPLFGHGQSSKEEYLLLKLAGALSECEIEKSGFSAENFMSNDFLFVRVALNFARGAKEVSYLKSLLGPLIDEIIGNEAISFETDPINIYREVIKQQEMDTGLKSTLPFDVTREEAFQNILVKERYVENLKALQLYSRKFVVAIISSFETLPYAIRYILAQIFKMIPQNRLVGHFVFYRYINPAIVSPETFDVLERPIGAIDRKNLAELSRILQFVVLNKQFTFEDYSHLIPLNDFVLQSHKAYYGFIDKLIQIEDLEAHFGLVPKGEESTGSNVIVVESDFVYMSMFQIYKIHEAVTTWCTSLKEITATLGPAPKAFQDDHSSIRIDLMKPRNFTVYCLDGHSTLLLVVKKYLLVVLGFYGSEGESDGGGFDGLDSGVHNCVDAEVATLSTTLNALTLPTLPTVLTVEALLSLTPSPMQEEAFLAKFPLSEDFQSIDSSPSSAPNSADYLASLSTLQRSLLGDIAKLEGFFSISHTDGYNGVLVALAQDLQSRSSKRRVLSRDLKSAHHTLQHLDDKSQYLGGRIQAINDYVKNAIQVLTSNAKIKKPLPFTKHYSHLKALERQGKLPRYGSFKYTAAELYSRGIIYSIAEYSVNQYDKISITISSNDPGVWVMEATLMGIKIPQSATLKLEDLLDSQFNNQPKMTLFGGIAKVNVNLLLHFLNRKFFE